MSRSAQKRRASAARAGSSKPHVAASPAAPARWQQTGVAWAHDRLSRALELDDAITAESAARQLLAELRPLVADDVREARQAGRSLAEVARLLGITRQGARQRFSDHARE